MRRFDPGRIAPSEMSLLQWGQFLTKFLRFLDGGPESETAANIADEEAAINVQGKHEGKQVWDTTNARMLRASGPDPTDDWDVIDGSASITPS